MDKIEEVLNRGVEKIYPSREELEAVLRAGKKIRLYQGFDPSMPSLHLGNFVGVMKLKQFQKLGHEVIFLVGDFTGMIGDPTNKSAARKTLTREQTLLNSKNWKKQIEKIIRFDGNNPAKFLFNSNWLDKVSFKDLIGITSHFTVQQMMERDFFQERLKENKPIYLHEFLYPIAQAFDSVEMEVDLEIGGSDQIFNMFCGRTLTKSLKNKEKFVLATKLLVDNKGQKVGKTTGNALFLDTAPAEMYGGIMSFPDEVICLGFELLTQVPMEQIEKWREDIATKQVNPMTVKKKLAFEVIKILHSSIIAKRVEKNFEETFEKKDLPKDVSLSKIPKGKYTLVDFLIKTGLVNSRAEAKRLIEQKAVEIDGVVIADIFAIVPLENKPIILRVGKKRFLKIIEE